MKDLYLKQITNTLLTGESGDEVEDLEK